MTRMPSRGQAGQPRGGARGSAWWQARFAVVALGALGLAACAGKDKGATGPKQPPQPIPYAGTFVGNGVSGALMATATGGVAGRAAGGSITGTLVVTGGSTIPISGTYDSTANPQITVSGGGYTMTGSYAKGSSQVSGTFVGPNATSGQWTASISGSGSASANVYCGTYLGTARGTWNLVVDATNAVTGYLYSASNGVVALVGSYSPGTDPNVTLSSQIGSTVTGHARGNVLLTGDAGGKWTDATGGVGFWTGHTQWCSAFPSTTANLSGAWALDTNWVYAVGDLGTILEYDGTVWSPIASGTHEPLSAMGPYRYVVGANGTILQLLWPGSWGPMASGATNTLYAVSHAPPNLTLVVVGAGGTILHLEGPNWVPLASGVTSALYGVTGVPGVGADFAVGAGGTILHYDSASATVTRQTSGTMNDLFFVSAIAATNVYAVGAAGTILHYDGTSWTAQASGTANALRGLDWWTATDLFAVGDGGTILHSADGATWSPQASGTTSNLTAVSIAAAGNAFAVGPAGLILHYHGAAWSRSH